MILDVQGDTNCLVRNLGLQGLGYAAEHLSYDLVSRHCNPIHSVLMNSLDYNNIGAESAVILEGMLSCSKLLTTMEGCKFSSFQVTAAVRIKPLLDQEDVNLRRAAFRLLGDLTQSINSEGNLEAFREQIHGNIITLFLHLSDPDIFVVKDCKYTLRKIGPYLDSSKVNSMIQEHLIDEANLHFADFVREFIKLMLRLLAFSIYIVTAHSSLQTIVANPGGIGGIFKGPDSETIIKGPDSSTITSEQKGGIIQTDQKLEPIIVAEPEIVEANYILPSLAEDGYIAPLVPVENVASQAYSNNIIPAVNSEILSPPTFNPIGPGLIAPLEPVVRETISLGHNIDVIEPEPHIIQTEIVDAPAIEPKESTDLVGPSGSISTRGSESIVSGPASTTITKTAKVLIAPPVISAAAVIPYTIPPVRAPPLIEVNHEIPGPIITKTSGAPTLYPLNIGGLSVSTFSPPVSSTPLPLGSVIQQPVPIQPPQSGPIFSTGLLTGEEFNVKYLSPTIIKTPTTINPIQVTHGQSVIPNQTPIVSIEDEGASGFIQPGSIYGIGTIPSSTLSPILSSTSPFYEGIPSSTISSTTSFGIIDSQHSLNPSDIPTRNIIPPEIGVSRGAIDLGTTVTKEQEAPRAHGLINLQGIDTDNIQRAEHVSDRIGNENTFLNGYYQTDVLLGTDPNSVYPQQKTDTINAPLLTETNPIRYQNGINGIPQYENGQPLVFSEPGISSYSDYDDRPAGNLWNRYGRKRRNRKY